MATFIKTDPSNGTQGTLPTSASGMIRQNQWKLATQMTFDSYYTMNKK